MKKTKEPILTVEEKASKANKQEIKGTGRLEYSLNDMIKDICVTPDSYRFQHADVLIREGQGHDRKLKRL